MQVRAVGTPENTLMMRSELLLIAASNPEEADNYGRLLMEAGHSAFVFANDINAAAEFVTDMRPGLIIAALHDEESLALCRLLRAEEHTRDSRVLVIIARESLSAARDAVPTAILLRPVADQSLAAEVHRVLDRVERRDLHRDDRRREFRGGRRIADVPPQPSR